MNTNKKRNDRGLKYLSERGAGLAEYGLLLALVALLCIGALGALQVGIDGALRQAGAMF